MSITQIIFKRWQSVINQVQWSCFLRPTSSYAGNSTEWKDSWIWFLECCLVFDFCCLHFTSSFVFHSRLICNTMAENIFEKSACIQILFPSLYHLTTWRITFLLNILLLRAIYFQNLFVLMTWFKNRNYKFAFKRNCMFAADLKRRFDT